MRSGKAMNALIKSYLKQHLDLERCPEVVDGLLTRLHELHASHLTTLEALAGVCHLQMIYA
jgi:hypothetical protein